MSIKEKINPIFTKNPEEIRGYVTGFCVYLGRGITNAFRKSKTPLSLNTAINEEKTAYSYLYNTKETPRIWREYGI
jgi:hypothetical protein